MRVRAVVLVVLLLGELVRDLDVGALGHRTCLALGFMRSNTSLGLVALDHVLERARVSADASATTYISKILISSKSRPSATITLSLLKPMSLSTVSTIWVALRLAATSCLAESLISAGALR